MVVGLVVVLVIGVGGWLYSEGKLFAGKTGPEVDPVLATEMLKELSPQEQEESLEDVKRWATELEEKVARDVTETRVPGRRISDVPAEYEDYRAYVPTETYFLSDTDEYVSPAPAPAPAQPERVPTPIIPPAPPRQAEPPVEDTPVRPYQPRKIEPIIYEPRNVEPY